ncbi:hypothetical protein GCM10023198_31550 [Promicromonospora umidemergens]|uniref:Uncharacterized protein n=1 Tax=Promicromonospora umidemergens TaxID=629679 RepID=A0ABP8XHM1_9MICO
MELDGAVHDQWLEQVPLDLPDERDSHPDHERGDRSAGDQCHEHGQQHRCRGPDQGYQGSDEDQDGERCGEGDTECEQQQKSQDGVGER